jgi:hypothetical protein
LIYYSGTRPKWGKFRCIKSVTEDILKLAKANSMEDLHRYTRSSVLKYGFLAVLLVGITKTMTLKKRRNYKPFLNDGIKGG